jgi:predicted DNA-binding protein with PD1-like motif
MRRVAQPGPAPAERIEWIAARGRHVAFELTPGRRLLDAVREGFAAEGFTSGVLNLVGGALGPFAYVMPALSQTGLNAAYYSEIYRPPGSSRIHTGALTFGTRDGEPFFHCHAFWTEPDGHLRGGHVLPDSTEIAETIRTSGIGLYDCSFAVTPDPETNFSLFQPVPQDREADAAAPRVFALRMRPNQDLSVALEDFCRLRGIPAAMLHGGVGSIIGARFEDGSRVDPFATEMAICSGHIRAEAGSGLLSEVKVALVDLTGAVAEGRLVRGDNPILMTLELILEPEPGGA